MMKTIVTLSSAIALSLAAHVSLAGYSGGFGYGTFGGNKAQGQQSRVERLMARFDTNRDGRITRKEVQSQRKAQFGKMDANGNGLVSLEEIKAFAEQNAPKDGRQQRRNRRGNRLEYRFARIDTNEDGQISLEEFTAKLRLFKKFDANKDGVITREELSRKQRRRRW